MLNWMYKTCFSIIIWCYIMLRICQLSGDMGFHYYFLGMVLVLLEQLKFDFNSETMMLIKRKYDQAQHLQNKWFDTLQNMPNGVLIYNIS